MFNDIGWHIDGVAGTDALFARFAAVGFPLDHALAAHDEIDLLEIRRVVDFMGFGFVFDVAVPVMRAVARFHFIDVESVVRELYSEQFWIAQLVERVSYHSGFAFNMLPKDLPEPVAVPRAQRTNHLCMVVVRLA
jgi:hypothetical protein